MDPFDLVGDVLDGEFRVEELIGEGALSVVYRAENVTMGASACVKCLNLPNTFDPAAAQSVVESFEEACKLHYRLARGHLAIAQTFTTGTTLAPRTGVQIHYLVREWLEGESLARNLLRRREEKMSGRRLPETVELLAPIAAALTYAHGQGAEHLSIMPSNVFLDKHGPKLLDFGVGRVVDDVASTRSPTAKKPPRIKLLLPTYAAPEQIDTTLGPTGPWTDVYALALLVLEVLSDKPVMSEKDAGAIIARALSATERPTPKRHGVLLSPRADGALVRALALEPESRQATIEELWEELASAVSAPAPRGSRPSEKTHARMSRHLRRVRRIKKATRPTSKRPPAPSFGEEEAPTNKVPIAMALLSASALRSSARPPPPTTKRVEPPPPPELPKAEPAVVLAEPPPAPPPSPPHPVDGSAEGGTSQAPLVDVSAPIPALFGQPRLPLDMRLLALAGGAAFVFIVIVVTAVALAVHHRSAPAKVAVTPSPRSAVLEVAPPTTPLPVVTEPPPGTSAEPPPARPGRFNHHQAVTAIKEAVSDLSACRKRGGVWGKGQAGVIFANDGSVRKVLMSAPFTGEQGQCVRDAISTAHIDPFVGVIGPTYVYFVIPY